MLDGIPDTPCLSTEKGEFNNDGLFPTPVGPNTPAGGPPELAEEFIGGAGCQGMECLATMEVAGGLLQDDMGL